MDKLTKEQRRKNMQAVKATGSKIETALAGMLFARGHRYRKNDKTVFGKPDLTIKKHKIAIFIDGEFWHGKDWEVRKNDHKTNQEFWHGKIERNIERDKEVNAELAGQGWTVLRFWGDEIKKEPANCILKIEETINNKMMNFNEKISIAEVEGNKLKIRIIEPENNKEAVLTHYIHNWDNTDIAKFYKKDALAYTKEILQYKYPEETITAKVADVALQYRIFETFDVPFPSCDNPKFTFIDLFAGIGGFRLALQNLGGKCVFTSEWDSEAKKTYKANFGDLPFGDITKEATKSYIPDGFDILCAGFPCQAFSIAGKRGGFEDTRGTLFFDVAEIIRRKQPKAIFLENVKGLLNHNGGKTLETILNVLRNDLDYFVPEPQIINAKHFGVPQNRERIYIVGFRKDLNVAKFKYPKPVRRKVRFSNVKEKDVVPTKYYLSKQYIQTLRDHKARHESKGNGFGFEIIPDSGISNAIVVGGMGRERNLVIDNRITDFTPTTNIKGEVNREGIRKMTPREWARLQGFPDNFLIPVADASAYKQFGNSVAVPAIRATANEILKQMQKTTTMITGNRGDWSEIYALFKLLGDGQVFAGDADLNKIENLFYPIIKILRTEDTDKCDYKIAGDIVIVSENGNEISKISVSEFCMQAAELLTKIKNSTGSAFSIPETEDFMKSIKCRRLKATSENKTDIRIIIHDLRTNIQPLLGFSIKSQLGSPSTLLNSSDHTTISYSIVDAEICPDDVERINAITTRSKIRDRIKEIEKLDGTLKYYGFESSVFKNNLVLIDSYLPEIIAEIVKVFYSSQYRTLNDIVTKLEHDNPLGFDTQHSHKFYEYKVKRLLTDAALGMKPATPWTGIYEATGGYLIVKEDGDVLCYHIYNKNEFENYLLANTKIETPSSGRRGVGVIETELGRQVFKLNLQIRFID